MSVSRRSILKGMVIAGAAGAAGAAGIMGGLRRPRGARGIMQGFVPFTVPLPKPPVLMPTALNPAPGSPAAMVGSPAVFHAETSSQAWRRLESKSYVSL